MDDTTPMYWPKYLNYCRNYSSRGVCLWCSITN